MDKDKKYQMYLKELYEGYGIKGMFFRLAKKNKSLFRQYLRLTNISVKKLKKIPNIKNEKIKILDIGCGTGSTLLYINEFINKNVEFYGVDLERSPILPDFVKFVRCDIESTKVPFDDESFDIVLSNFVIEHLKNPEKLFLEAFRLLKRGGNFYCTSDYYISIFAPDYWNFYADPTHVRPWTKRALTTLSKITGFELHKVGVIRWWEFLPLIPVFPLLNFISKSNFSFIPYEIFGRTVYIISTKP